MKVIFLDFDGVLNTVGYNRELGEVTFGGTTTTLDNPHAINMVQALVDFTGAKVVVSSSWRCMGLERVKAVLAKSNLHCDVIGITPELGGERGLEIQA